MQNYQRRCLLGTQISTDNNGIGAGSDLRAMSQALITTAPLSLCLDLSLWLLFFYLEGPPGQGVGLFISLSPTES